MHSTAPLLFFGTSGCPAINFWVKAYLMDAQEQTSKPLAFFLVGGEKAGPVKTIKGTSQRKFGETTPRAFLFEPGWRANPSTQHDTLCNSSHNCFFGNRVLLFGMKGVMRRGSPVTKWWLRKGVALHQVYALTFCHSSRPQKRRSELFTRSSRCAL